MRTQGVVPLARGRHRGVLAGLDRAVVGLAAWGGKRGIQRDGRRSGVPLDVIQLLT